MSGGMDRLPGHAYAPGFEPGWFDVVVSWDRGAGFGGVMPAVLLSTLILLLLVRLIASSPRLRNRGVRGRRHAVPASPAPGAVDFGRIVARTLTDPNFATEPRLSRRGNLRDETDR
jgi:hypothetical protein